MTTRVDPGHYRVEEDATEDEKKSTTKTKKYGVIRGDVANEAERGVFGKQIGFRSSKWYAYCLTTTDVEPRLTGFSPTAPQSAFTKHFSELRFAQTEFDTKKDAVARAEEMVDDYEF